MEIVIDLFEGVGLHNCQLILVEYFLEEKIEVELKMELLHEFIIVDIFGKNLHYFSAEGFITPFKNYPE